jgi:hypothetical protein
MRVMRANLDGSNIETLVDTSKGDARRAPIERNGASGSPSIRTADKFIGRKKVPTMRARAASFARRSTSRKARRGEPHRHRTLFDGLPEPIDLELDLKNRFIYWTDRGDPPRGNTVNRASMTPISANIRARTFCSRI